MHILLKIIIKRNLKYLMFVNLDWKPINDEKRRNFSVTARLQPPPQNLIVLSTQVPINLICPFPTSSYQKYQIKKKKNMLKKKRKTFFFRRLCRQLLLTDQPEDVHIQDHTSWKRSNIPHLCPHHHRHWVHVLHCICSPAFCSFLP